MKYFIYKVTNKVNNKFIIGRKINKTLYFKIKTSSNKKLLEDIKIYGAENFNREIIYECSNKLDLKYKYEEIKNKVIKDSLCYAEKYEMSDVGKANIAKAAKAQSNKLFPKFKGLIDIEDRYNFKITNYCPHGEFVIHKALFRRMSKIDNPIYCPKCREEFHEEDTRKYLQYLTSPKNHEPHWIEIYYPSLYKNILKTNGSTFAEKLFMYKNNLETPPKCLICDSEVRFSNPKSNYNAYCDTHAKNLRTSKGEIELRNFIKSILPDTEVIENYRLNTLEIDVYIPSLNIGFEHNGLYWHSEKFKERRFHLDKKEFFKKNGIDLFFVWSDDWQYKKYIIKSIILNKLNKNIKINSTETIIKQLKSSDVFNFLNENNIHGYIAGSVNLGLFYKDELISVMNFSKNRGKQKGYELLRYCNKLNINIEGSINKLFNYFIEEFKPERVILNIDRDLFKGEIYSKLGFENKGNSSPNFWWTNNHHKFSRQKYKILKDENLRNEKTRVFNKVWNSGSTKWVYTLLSI